MLNSDSQLNDIMRDVYNRTDILRKPLSGIVSGYHDLSYVMIAPSDENAGNTLEITGKIKVSPKFIISANSLTESFGEVFDPETFDKEIEGRFFSFAYANKKNLKVESADFRLEHFEKRHEEHLGCVLDSLMQKEDTRTGLIFCPDFKYYPVSIDRFITEILDREFRV
jgi:hypothetical protein